MCEMFCQIVQKKQEEKRIKEEQAASARYWKIPACCYDDDDYDPAITPILSIEEPINSLNMGDEHLDTIPTTRSDEVIKSSVGTIDIHEPDNSLSMRDKHLDTILAMKSDEFIKSSVENLISNPSESEGEYKCDVPACEVFPSFLNILFDADYDFPYSDDQLFSDEDFPKEI
nr:hypothetical protein [Tanacetum cinerariifolium]